MLVKARDEGLDWAKFLLMALFALRQMPNVDTGLFPFQLTYEFCVRGPLDLQYTGWVDEAYSELDVCSWVTALQDRLRILNDECYLKFKKAKDRKRESFNKHRSESVQRG